MLPYPSLEDAIFVKLVEKMSSLYVTAVEIVSVIGVLKISKCNTVKYKKTEADFLCDVVIAENMRKIRRVADG